MTMKNKKYKILFLNNRQGSIKEINFSKRLIFSLLLVFFVSNFLIFNYLAEDYVIWRANSDIQNHKENNKTLVASIENSKNRISNIEEKLNNIVEHDNNIREMLKLPKIHDDVRSLGIGGSTKEESFQNLEYLLPDDELNLQSYFDKLDYLDRLANLEVLSFMEMNSNTEKNKTKLRHLPAIYPINMDEAKLTSRFGYRRDPFTKKYKKHEGDDFSAKTGTDVIATADGLCVIAIQWFFWSLHRN